MKKDSIVHLTVCILLELSTMNHIAVQWAHIMHSQESRRCLIVLLVQQVNTVEPKHWKQCLEIVLLAFTVLLLVHSKNQHLMMLQIIMESVRLDTIVLLAPRFQQLVQRVNTQL